MNFTHTRIDVEATLAKRGSLVDIIGRDAGDTWLIVHSHAVDFDKPVDWRRSLRGNVVPVPLIPYAMTDELDVALGFMVQMGVRLTSQIDGQIARLHLAIGNPVAEEQLPNDGGRYWRYWLGFAVLLQK